MLQGNTLKLVEHTVTEKLFLTSRLTARFEHPFVFSDVHVKIVILDWVDVVCSFAPCKSSQNLGWKRCLKIFLEERESPPWWKWIRVSDDLIYDNHCMHTAAWCSGNKLHGIMSDVKRTFTDVINLTSVDLNSILFAFIFDLMVQREREFINFVTLFVTFS